MHEVQILKPSNASLSISFKDMGFTVCLSSFMFGYIYKITQGQHIGEFTCFVLKYHGAEITGRPPHAAAPGGPLFSLSNNLTISMDQHNDKSRLLHFKRPRIVLLP